MATTLADVAARAGVSPATVSRVLNGNYPVAAATRRRVERAVDELNYVINGHARALAASTSDMLGVLVNDMADPFFGVMASGIQSAAAAGGLLAIVCNTDGSPQQELTYLKLLQRQRAGAVVLTGGSVEDPEHNRAVASQLSLMSAQGCRVVLCGRPPMRELDAAAAPSVATVTFANREGARALTAHLIALGHRRIGYVTGPAERTTTRHRLEGHRQALADAGLPDDPRLVAAGDYSRASGYDAALELLRREPGVTALVAANDTMALGVCAVLRERGLRIPEDVSVAGFDDLPFSLDAAPSLTTVRVPLRQAGEQAGKLAVGSRPMPPGGLLTLPTELLVRRSVGPAPERSTED
ncbi:LacI family DNA-binding transcriptional regulator [Allostreptomyces psammosilenae]|uniref:LacI family transcriptional regulator n=1 Tax=Allostreptomyces psammosilenae TaxID=1892865 RepID=A0A853A3L7_9ACTN|nr:LacI family DNA-binding transcriptional regulator [Allostreptomyces psammosilenae]NYI05102.1 LacI family transcriptional regulator [Allostreptomyces psammosilenae]